MSLPDVREWSGDPPKCPRVVRDPLGCPGVVGCPSWMSERPRRCPGLVVKPFRMSRKPSRMSGSVRKALPDIQEALSDVREWSGGPP